LMRWKKVCCWHLRNWIMVATAAFKDPSKVSERSTLMMRIKMHHTIFAHDQPGAYCFKVFGSNLVVRVKGQLFLLLQICTISWSRRARLMISMCVCGKKVSDLSKAFIDLSIRTSFDNFWNLKLNKESEISLQTNGFVSLVSLKLLICLTYFGFNGGYIHTYSPRPTLD
jgi:hypothetical protein